MLKWMKPGFVMDRLWWAGPGLGRARPASQARPINFLYDGPRPSPAHQIKYSEDGPRPGPAHHIFKTSLPGPAPSDPAHHFLKGLDRARPVP